jgi:hypothetical protein
MEQLSCCFVVGRLDPVRAMKLLVQFQVLATLTTKNTIFWDVTMESGRIFPTFRWNLLPLSSELKSKPSK